MRLVLVVTQFPHVSETFIVNKFVGLVDAGWDVHVVCRDFLAANWQTFPSLASRPDLRTRVHHAWRREPRRAAGLWLPAFLSTLRRAPRTTIRYWRAVWSGGGRVTAKQFYLDAAVIALRPDILHFEFGALATDKTYLKHALACRLGVSFRGYDLNFVGLDDPDYYAPLWAAADAIHLLGGDLWRRALRRGCPPDKPHALIPPAIDVDYFAWPGERDDAIGRDRPLHILSVGRLEWKKGYEYALSAVRRLGERGLPFEYRVVGDGGYLEALTFARHEMGLGERVHFLGALPQTQIVEQMAWADVFLHPAVSEGLATPCWRRRPCACRSSPAMPTACRRTSSTTLPASLFPAAMRRRSPTD
jgi:colanic acid/amylovoran biosynthesis glycosyltransferase